VACSLWFVGQVDTSDAYVFGFDSHTLKTEAEKLAAQLVSDRSPSGRVDADQLEDHQRKLAAEDALRRGEQVDLLSFGRNEQLEIQKNARMSPFVARASRLPMPQFLQVWERDDGERAGRANAGID